jgi:hypothetical protein
VECLGEREKRGEGERLSRHLCVCWGGWGGGGLTEQQEASGHDRCHLSRVQKMTGAAIGGATSNAIADREERKRPKSSTEHPTYHTAADSPYKKVCALEARSCTRERERERLP